MGEEWYQGNNMYPECSGYSSMTSQNGQYIESNKNLHTSVDNRNVDQSNYQCFYPEPLYSHGNTPALYSDQVGYSPYTQTHNDTRGKNDCFQSNPYYDAYDYSKFENYTKYTQNTNVLQAITSRLCSKMHRKNCTSQKGSQIKVTLENKKLFERFTQFGTEMIITKTGRRMFPSPQVSVQGLEPSTKYFILFDTIPADENRYKYHHFKWVVAGRAEPLPPARFYIHPESPLTGSQWMKQQIIFHKVKLTNNSCDQRGHIVLNSMHRYIPRVHVVVASEPYNLQNQQFQTFSFKECIFTAVTAYQNAQVTQLKIEHNPFAKGFRKPEKEKREKKKEQSSKKQCIDKAETAKTFQEICEMNAKTYEEDVVSFEERNLEKDKPRALWPIINDAQRPLQCSRSIEHNDNSNHNNVNNNNNEESLEIPSSTTTTQYGDKYTTAENFDFQKYHLNAAAYGILDQLKAYPQPTLYTTIPYRANGPSFI